MLSMDTLNKIKDLISEESYNEARTQLIEYIKDGRENDVEVLKLLGLTEVNLELYSDAKNTFEKVIKISPKDATSLFYLANCLDNLDNVTEAEKYYSKVLQIREGYIDAYKSLCIIYLKTNREYNAIELAKKAKALNLDAIHDTVHEMARDEARHGKAFEGLLKRYFG